MAPAQENKSDKGEFNGSCNRTCCQRTLMDTRGGNWWNKATRAYYCQGCAIRINENNNLPYRDRVLSLVIPVTDSDDRPPMNF